MTEELADGHSTIRAQGPGRPADAMGVAASHVPAGDAAAHAKAMLQVEEGIAHLLGMMRGRWQVLAREVHPDLQPIGFRIVMALYAGGPQRATDLVERLGSNKSVLSRQLAQLQGLGLVERRVDSDDGRLIHMAVTQDAIRRLIEVATRDDRPHFRKLYSWPTERLHEFASMVEDVSGADVAETRRNINSE